MSITSKAIKTDAIIVLANQMDKKGLLNFESIARANKAVEILNELETPNIVTCGWAYRKDSDIKIADAFKSYITNTLGVNPNKVITELNSRDTVGDAYFTKINLALILNWKRLFVVTSDYHVERTQEIFNFIYGNNFLVEVFGASIIYDNSILSRELASTEAFRKTFTGISMGDDIKILERLRERHPFYNGQVYSKI
jgi:uncharacterized SAM-binding protein YcdF (DUF218 family)